MLTTTTTNTAIATAEMLLPSCATPTTTTAAATFDAASDNALLEATREGSEIAFAEIVHRYRHPITNYCYRLLGDYETAIDLAQETFVRVYRARARYKPSHAFSTYIYRIATNLAISEIRRRRRRRLISLSSFFSRGNNNNPNGKSNVDGQDTVFDAPDARPLPDASLIERERQQTVQRAIATLPETYRVPLVLRDIEEHSYDEIALLLNANLGTIKSRISRARLMLRDKLASQI